MTSHFMYVNPNSTNISPENLRWRKSTKECLQQLFKKAQ